MKINKIRLGIVLLVMLFCIISAIITYHSDSIVKEWSKNENPTAYTRTMVGIFIGGFIFPIFVGAVLLIVGIIAGLFITALLDFVTEPTPEEIEEEEADVISPAELKVLKESQFQLELEPEETIPRESLLDIE